MVAIAVTAGNAGKVARRRGARVPFERSREDGEVSSTSWGRRAWTMPFPGSLPHGGAGLDAQAGAPLVYVRDPRGVAQRIGLERPNRGRGVLLLAPMSGELDDVENEGGHPIRSAVTGPARCLLRPWSGSGRGRGPTPGSLGGRVMNGEFDQIDPCPVLSTPSAHRCYCQLKMRQRGPRIPWSEL